MLLFLLIGCDPESPETTEAVSDTPVDSAPADTTPDAEPVDTGPPPEPVVCEADKDAPTSTL
ncbi:MAG: hypothetical protein ACI8RZ_007711, partial [Myxococcota bacterium]